MIEPKLIEIRDKGTFIPAMAVRVTNDGTEATYLIRRAGWQSGGVYLFSLTGGRPCNYDPYDWCDRTFKAAHHYIEQHFDELESGAVVDVEFVLGETAAPKVSEREEVMP